MPLFHRFLIVQVWNFWEDSDEFYPDGLDRCPPETYTINEDASRRIGCFDCPVCPTGEEPSPPCGITLTAKPSGKCIPCRPRTYSDKVGSTSCKTCSDCGSRTVISSCTAEKNIECQECPKKQYEDEKTHTCKPCSACCPKSFATQIECMRTKKCKPSCVWGTKPRKYFKKKITGNMNTTYDKAFTKDLTMSLKQSYTTNTSQFIDQYGHNDKNISQTKVKRDVEAEVDVQRDSTDNTDSQTGKTSNQNKLEELDFLETRDIIKRDQKDVELLMTDRGKNSNHLSTPKKSSNGTKIHAVQEENPVSSQMSPGENYITFQRTVALPKEVTEVRQVTPHMEGAQNEFLNSALGSFTGTILAVIFFGLLVLFVYILYKKCVSKMLKGRKKVKRTSSDPADFHNKEYYSVVGTLDTSERERLVNETTNETQDEASTATVSQDLNLAEIPPDLLDKLVMRLDVPQADKSITQGKTFGWQTVGNEVGIPQTELKYYEHLGRHASESPTKILLDKMGSQGKTISDLVDVLNKPKLKLGNVAETIIRHRVTRI